MNASFRIFPDCYTLDAYIFDELITHADRGETVGTPGNPRLFPAGLDIMAAFGSVEARRILLDELKEGRFQNYEQRLDAVSREVQGFARESWERNIYQQWLGMLEALTREPANSPAFTRAQAWKRKQLNTALGSWVNLRYETNAYVEQAVAECGEAGYEHLNIGYPRGYVEPNPEFFRRLNAGFGKLAGMYAQVVADPELKKAILGRIEEYRGHLATLEGIARKELVNARLTDEEYKEILYIGRTIEHFILIMGSCNAPDNRAGELANPDSIRKIVDVQRSPFDTTRLYEALGYANEINVAVPYFGRRQIVRGPVYSYYEFQSPGQWTNEKWKQTAVYKLPVWIRDYYEGRSLMSGVPSMDRAGE